MTIKNDKLLRLIFLFYGWSDNNAWWHCSLVVIDQSQSQKNLSYLTLINLAVSLLTQQAMADNIFVADSIYLFNVVLIILIV